MIIKNDMEDLSSSKNGVLSVSDESMLGKVFGYFFSE